LFFTRRQPARQATKVKKGEDEMKKTKQQQQQCRAMAMMVNSGAGERTSCQSMKK
jgi:hypothetical protein